MDCPNHIRRTKCSIKKRIIVRWSVWSMFGWTNIHPVKNGLNGHIFIGLIIYMAEKLVLTCLLINDQSVLILCYSTYCGHEICETASVYSFYLQDKLVLYNTLVQVSFLHNISLFACCNLKKRVNNIVQNQIFEKGPKTILILW